MGAQQSRADKQPRHLSMFIDTLPDMSGKTVAVTGTTSGLGFHAAQVALRQGATVYCLNRPSERAQASLEKMQHATVVQNKAHHIDCDLQSFDAVRTAARQLSQACGSSGLDVLCNNAGVMLQQDTVTKDGFEVQMQTNHLSHFLLTSLLMPSLEEAAAHRGEARVVNHASGARKGSPLQQEYFESGAAGTRGGDGMRARYERYHQSKLANMVFTDALQDRLDKRGSKVIACAAHPGFCSTSMQHNTDLAEKSSQQWLGKLYQAAMPVLIKFAQSEQDGAMPVLQCMCSKQVVPRAFYGPSQKGLIGLMKQDTMSGPPKQLQPESNCTDAQAKDMLWRQSERACGNFFDSQNVI